MRAWSRWFRSLSRLSKYTVVGAILGALSLVLGFISLVPAYRGSGPSSPAPPPRPQPTQQIAGDGNVQIGSVKDVRDLSINLGPKMRTRTVLQNAGSNVALVLKAVDAEPDMLAVYAHDAKKRLAFVPVGTEVRVLPEKRSSTKGLFHASYTKVELLEGEYKGRVGWAAVHNIRSESVPE